MPTLGGLQMGYGNYLFPVGSVGYVPTVTSTLNSRGLPITRTVNIALTGMLFADGSTNNMLQRKYFDAAMQAKNVDLYIRNESGTEILRYYAAQALRGMTCMRHSFPDPNEGQLVTHSTFEAQFEGEFPIAQIFPGFVIEYTETIQQVGNSLAEFAWMYPLNAKPVSFRAHQWTTVKYVQQGQAIGWDDWPVIPPPIFQSPVYFKQDKTIIAKGSRQGPGLRQYPIQWQYFFELDYKPANINPTLWPRGTY